jgi:LAS seventeen-binding protein 1/2
MEGCAVLQRSYSTRLLTFNPKEPNDLTMSVGDVIDIVEETNADWWTGRNRGKQGFFPSNYVQKLPPESSSQPYQEKLYGAPGYHNDYANHPPSQQANPVNDTLPVNSIGLQQDEGQDKKKNKFGKFGNTVRPFSLPS